MIYHVDVTYLNSISTITMTTEFLSCEMIIARSFLCRVVDTYSSISRLEVGRTTAILSSSGHSRYTTGRFWKCCCHVDSVIDRAETDYCIVTKPLDTIIPVPGEEASPFPLEDRNAMGFVHFLHCLWFLLAIIGELLQLPYHGRQCSQGCEGDVSRKGPLLLGQPFYMPVPSWPSSASSTVYENLFVCVSYSEYMDNATRYRV